MRNTHLLFDWGNTLMEDLPYTGPMHTWPEIAVVDNAAQVMAELSSLYPCHIATNAHDSTADDIRRALQRGGLDRYISEIFCYLRSGHKKPEPEFFRFIGNDLQVPFSNMIMIGDSLENDIQGAMAHGMKALWFNRHNAHCPANIRSFQHLHELPALLNTF